MSESIDTAVVLAAGLGTRMRSALPKVLHEVCGLPLLGHVLAAVSAAGANRIVVVVRPGQGEAVASLLPPGAVIAVQETQRGTGDALLAAAEHLGEGSVLVVPGDTPLLTSVILLGLIEARTNAGADAVVLTLVPPDPTGYGRVVRDGLGDVERIVEHRDATAAELELDEVNAAAYLLPGRETVEILRGLEADNEQGELYLTDVVGALRARGKRVAAHVAADYRDALGINTRVELADAQAVMRERILRRWMLLGVTVDDPASTHVDATVDLEPDVRILPFTSLRGRTRVARGSEIGPASTLVDTMVGSDCRVRHSYTDGAVLEAGAQVGPFSYLRPEAHLLEASKAGAFVEIKKSTVGRGSKVPHLSYIGDATIGTNTNIGAGNITANYDGRRKHRTIIGDNVKTGSDTVFVAPVTVGDGTTTGAGSVITKDIPEGALGIARARQRNIAHYGAPSKSAAETGDGQGGSDE
ncbi:MAG: bifunctional UDP-N-acetylglucosamine diphosphorylase/glucosamine-1-phosphate N-acetyltransferase GlmU [Thermoleophilia bacterium]